MAATKKAFLVAYDYGMGGLWGFVLARDSEAIRSKYPELAVDLKRPDWMSDSQYEFLRMNRTFDLDEKPRGLLAVILAERDKD